AQIDRPDVTAEKLSAWQLQGLPEPPLGTQAFPAPPTLAAGARAQDTDPRGNVWQSRFDWLGFGQVSQELNPLANMAVQYRDANGLSWLSADALGRRSRSFFNSQGNATLIVAPDDSAEKFVYNNFSEPTQHTDANNNITTYEY